MTSTLPTPETDMPFQLKLWPTLFTIPALITLIGLGAWQMDRLYWKEALIEQLQERSTAEPIALPSSIDNLETLEFRRVSVTGEFLHEHEFYLFNRSLKGKPGLNVITLLKRADGSGHVLVNRGWVPFEKRDPTTRPKGQIEGRVTIEGIIRIARGPGMFTPKNEPQNNTWFFVDPSSMSASAKIPPLQGYYLLAANKSSGGVPVGHQWRINLPNDHLHYAITWFALAVGLLVVYILFHRQQMRKSP